MKLEDVMKLLDAGFSKEEIFEMQQENPQGYTQTVENPETEQTKLETKNSSETKPEPVPDPAEQLPDPAYNNMENANIEKLNASIEKLIRTIHASNLQNNFTGSTGAVDIDKQVDKIMAGIIRPEQQKGE